MSCRLAARGHVLAVCVLIMMLELGTRRICQAQVHAELQPYDPPERHHVSVLPCTVMLLTQFQMGRWPNSQRVGRVHVKGAHTKRITSHRYHAPLN